MTITTRRLLIAIGAAMLIGGWGATQYVQERRQSMPMEGRPMLMGLGVNIFSVTTPTIYIASIVTMSLGAGLVGFSALGTDKGTA